MAIRNDGYKKVLTFIGVFSRDLFLSYAEVQFIENQ